MLESVVTREYDVIDVALGLMDVNNGVVRKKGVGRRYVRCGKDRWLYRRLIVVKRAGWIEYGVWGRGWRRTMSNVNGKVGA